MTLIAEDGTGVSGANAYTTRAFVDPYFVDRGTTAWTGSDDVKDEAIINATDYIERRWGLRFLGKKEFQDISAARATLTFTGQPADAETVVIGSQTYTFNTVLGGANSVLIGATTEASILNLVNAVLATATAAGTEHGIGTVVHADVTTEEGVGDTLIAEAKEKGTAGNGIVATTTVVNATWSSATLTGGGDVRIPQPLEFPRINLIDRAGFVVAGVPLKLEQATAEYALRALTAALLPDPTIDASGKAITSKREKVGPIDVETRFESGGASSNLLRPYPNADRLLTEFIKVGNRVIRG